MRRVLLLVMALVLSVSALSVWSENAGAVDAPVRGLAHEVYFEQTGHHVSEMFLQYWWYNGGLDQFGFPLTEDLTIDGREVQYFERARFEWHPDNPASFQVLLGHLGTDVTAGRKEAAFKSFPADLKYEPVEGRRFFPETGHFLSYGFKEYWENNGGLYIYGYPISEEFKENGYTVQYFERARFEYHPEHQGTRYEVQLGLLGTQRAQADKVPTAPVAQNPGTPIWPAGDQLPAKWIEINLSVPQTLTAWEGGTPVYSTTVSGGLADTPTPVGTFEIYWKLRYDDMTGGTAGYGDYYYLPDVPHVMYFAAGGYAIHGTYWHGNWGYPMSHGCVNLQPAAAEWVYNWAPYGTQVWIHY